MSSMVRRDAGLIVLRADDLAAFGVGAGDVGRGAVAADVVPAGLRIVFDGEEAGVLPKPAVADGVNNSAHGQIVVGRHRRRGSACRA